MSYSLEIEGLVSYKHKLEAENVRLVNIILADVTEIDRLRKAIRFAKGEFEILRRWLDRAEDSDYKYRDDPALRGHRQACIDAAKIMAGACGQ